VQAPDKILDKHLGILGINGSGKTYTAKGLAERLLDAKQRVCVIDPTGVWYGLKSSATGKSAGYPVVIFGGPHADLQISGSHGEAIAEAIGTSSTSAIIDTSLMRGGERTKFFADFAETLRIKNKGPLNLFVDEAHLFMPQGRVADPQSANMLHAANNLISLGRSRGLRVTIISQRPAKIHKDSLTQVHSLIAMRLIAPQDRAAVEAWIADQADVSRGKEIIASLPSLKTGEGWLWAPEINMLERVKFPKISTFDSSKSPDGEGTGSIVLAPINLDAIQGRLASLKQEKVANDPSTLKRRVAELEVQLRAKPTALRAPDTKAIIAATAEAYRKGYDDGIGAYRMSFAAVRATLAQRVFDTITRASLSAPKAPKRPTPTKLPPEALSERPPAQKTVIRPGEVSLSGPERRILKSLQFWKSIGHAEPTRHQVALVAGYSPNTSSFKNALGSLRTAGATDSPRPGRVSLTATVDEDVMDLTAARGTMLSVLDGPHNRIIEAFNADAAAISRDKVAEGSGYSPNTSSFKNAVGRLSTLGILTRPSMGMLALSDWAREVLS
jgi:hypothetical protein